MGKTIGLFGGGFKPPTAGHFNVVKKALEDLKDLDELIIFVGSGIRDGITQPESIKVWEIYKNYLDSKVKIMPAKSPIGDIIRYGKNNPDDTIYFIIGAREQVETDFKDFASRTKGIEEKYPNMKIKLITTSDTISGTKARLALQDSYKDFTQYLPDELSEKDKEEVFNVLTSPLTETPQNFFSKEMQYLINEDIQTNLDRILFYQDYFINVSPSTFNVDIVEENIVISGINKPYPPGFNDVTDTKQVPVNLNLEENQPEDGKAAPYGSGYNTLNENASYSKDIDIQDKINQLTQHMINKGYNIEPLPKVEFVDGDVENAREFLGKTAYYNPNIQTIVLYTEGRHPKDIVRSFAHEIIHHVQNLEGRLGNITTTNTQEDGELNKIEAEANLKGTMTFRNWTDSLNEENKPHKPKHGFDDKLGKDPFGLNQYARELAHGLEEAMLMEGRYDAFVNKLSRIAFESFKGIHDKGDKKGKFSFRVDHPDDEHDIPSEEFYFDFEGRVEITDDKYEVDGGANAGFDNKGEEITPLLSVSFIIPKNPDWQKVSFDIKDVVRHELEHLTQDGDNMKSGKQMDDDQLIRDLIDADMLPKSQYFKLKKEVDAMLQGLYFKAKKSKRPFKDVANDYLNIFLNQGTITQEEKEDILNIWRSRIKALSLPVLEIKKKVMDYEIYSDMDGVLTDFDASFMKSSGGILPSEYEKNKPYKHKHGFDDKLGKDPFGLNAYALELARGLEEAIVGEKIECDNCDWSWDIKDGGDDLYLCHKCWHDNTPST